MSTVTYALSRSLVAPGRSAKGALFIADATGAQYGFGDVLVDTGAEYVVLPKGAGLWAGYSLPSVPSGVLKGLGGSAGAHLVRGVSLEFDGLPLKADVMFDYSGGAPALFGRTGIFALMQLGIDPAKWHR